jgi:hypothetical protein
MLLRFKTKMIKNTIQKTFAGFNIKELLKLKIYAFWQKRRIGSLSNTFLFQYMLSVIQIIVIK